MTYRGTVLSTAIHPTLEVESFSRDVTITTTRWCLYLSPADARELARHLVAAADNVEVKRG